MAAAKKKRKTSGATGGRMTKVEKKALRAVRRRAAGLPVKRTFAEVVKATKNKATAAKMLAGAKKLQAGVAKGVTFWTKVLAAKKK